MEKEVIKHVKEMDKNEFLERERQSIQDKLELTLQRNDVNTYKNLIQAYERILTLQSQEDKWTQMYSKYETRSNDKEDFIPVVSTWEQKGEEIRNHRIFEISREIDNKEYELYFEAEYRMNSKREPIFSECNIYFNEEIIKLSGNMEGISEYIINLTKDKKVKIYGEDIGDGYGLVSILKNKGIGVIGKKTKSERVYEGSSNINS